MKSEATLFFEGLAANGQQLTDESLPSLLARLSGKGVRLWSEGGHLRFRAPKGRIAANDLELLRLFKTEIVALLNGVADAVENQALRGEGAHSDRFPLSFSQFARWNLHNLGARRGLRQIVSALRLSGRLDHEMLRKSITKVNSRHDILRARIFEVDGVPCQEIAKCVAIDLALDDLTAMPQDLREAEVIRIIERTVMEPLDFSSGHLFVCKLLRVNETDSVLVLAMEHMISDVSSLRILENEIRISYGQLAAGQEISLPPVAMQFADYAMWQIEHQSQWAKRHAHYWNQRLSGCERLRIPPSISQADDFSGRVGWAIAPVEFSRDLRFQIGESCRQRRSTVVMNVFAAYVALVLRWCNTTDSVVQFQSDARASPNIQNTIGLFTSALYMRIGMSDSDTFSDLLDRVTEEFCNAVAHDDQSAIAARTPRPEFTRNTVFNWVPRESKSQTFCGGYFSEELTCSRIHFEHPLLRHLEMDLEPFMLLYDSDEGVTGGFHYPRSRYLNQDMERFSRNFCSFVVRCTLTPLVRLRDLELE